MHNPAPLRTVRPVGDAQSNHSSTPSKTSNDVVADVSRELSAALELARRDGVPRWHRIIDPGHRFRQDARTARRAHRPPSNELQALGYPLIFGCSRKGFLGKMAGGTAVDDRLPATIAANTMAVERGAQIVRVHDVRENVQAIRVVNAILGGYSDGA